MSGRRVTSFAQSIAKRLDGRPPRPLWFFIDVVEMAGAPTVRPPQVDPTMREVAAMAEQTAQMPRTYADMTLAEQVAWAEEAILKVARIEGRAEEEAAREVFTLASKVLQCGEKTDGDEHASTVQERYLEGQCVAIETALKKAGVEIVE